MTKYVLIKYLVMYINAHAQDEEIAAVDPKSIPKMRKRDLIETVLNFWGSPKEAVSSISVLNTMILFCIIFRHYRFFF